MTNDKGKIDPSRLYLGDNGRCFCGTERCAGMTPFYTGRDLSGQRLYRLTPEDDVESRRMSAEFQGFKCEGCGKRLSPVTA
jgi:hypothetical protein